MIAFPVFVIVFLTSGVFRIFPPAQFFSSKFFPLKELSSLPADVPKTFRIVVVLSSLIPFSLFALFGKSFFSLLPDLISRFFREIIVGALLIIALEKVIFALRHPKLPAPQYSIFSLFSFFSAILVVIFAVENFTLLPVLVGIIVASGANFSALKYGNIIFKKYGDRGIWLFEGLSAIPILMMAGKIW